MLYASVEIAVETTVYAAKDASNVVKSTNEAAELAVEVLSKLLWKISSILLLKLLSRLMQKFFSKLLFFLNAATAVSTEAGIETVADRYKIKVKVIKKFNFEIDLFENREFSLNIQ